MTVCDVLSNVRKIFEMRDGVRIIGGSDFFSGVYSICIVTDLIVILH